MVSVVAQRSPKPLAEVRILLALYFKKGLNIDIIINTMIKDIPKKIFGFFKAVFAELKLIEFPSRKVTLKTGNMVIFISLAFGLSLYLIDWLFQVLRNLLTSINI